MAILGGVLDWVAKLAGIVGLPSVIIYLLLYRRRVRALGRTDDAHAAVAEATVPIAVKSSSVTQLEAELAALAHTFETDRRLKGETIDWLKGQLEAERQASALKDEKIRELERKVGSLQHKVRELTDELGRVAEELADLHDSPGEQAQG